MPKILVTGATGFIGSHLAEALRGQGKQIVCLVRPNSNTSGLQHPNISIHPGDLMDPRSLRGCCNDVRTIYHLGACAALNTRNEQDLEVNSTGTANLLKEASDAGTVRRFILISSLAAAARPRGQRLRLPLDDRCQAVPDTPYGRSKREAEIAVQASGLPYVILRPALVYGPRSRPNAGMNALVRAVETNRFVSGFNLPGRISIVYIADLIRACLLAAQHPEAINRTFFVSDTRPVTFGEIFRTTRRLLGRQDKSRPLPLYQTAGSAYDLLDRWIGISGLIPSYLLAPISASLACESRTLQQRLGYQPRYSLNLGLSQLLRTPQCV